MTHVFIIGSRGLPACYGGFETFVEELIKHKKSTEIFYHVACLSDATHHCHFEYLGADCFTIRVPKIGSARVIIYDAMAMKYAISLIKKEQISFPIFYILGNTIGFFIQFFSRVIHRLGGRLFVNPDGLEWKRSKWSYPVKSYLKQSEKVMTKYVDLVISDSMVVRDYIRAHYPWSKTSFIAYGADLVTSSLRSTNEKVRNFYRQWGSHENNYYLVLGRFVPENNYETVIIEFMKTNSKRDLLIICNQVRNSYFEDLVEKTGFPKDKRIKFVGAIYDKDLVTYIRENTFAYIHGHEVGGTNPSLLEALAHTNLNLVLQVDFNLEVAQDTVFYWTKEDRNLADLIERVEYRIDYEYLGQQAKEHIRKNYTWEKIVGEYEELFLL